MTKLQSLKCQRIDFHCKKKQYFNISKSIKYPSESEHFSKWNVVSRWTIEEGDRSQSLQRINKLMKDKERKDKTEQEQCTLHAALTSSPCVIKDTLQHDKSLVLESSRIV